MTGFTIGVILEKTATGSLTTQEAEVLTEIADAVGYMTRKRIIKNNKAKRK